jgi:hypothetical protein
MVLAACGALLGLAGCHSAAKQARRDEKALHRQAAAEMNCPARQLVVTPNGPVEAREYMVMGCGKRALYRETDQGLMLASQIELLTPEQGTLPPPPPPQ